MSPDDSRWCEFLLDTLPGMKPAAVGLLRATLAAADVELKEWLDLDPKRRAKIAPLPEPAERALPLRMGELRRLWATEDLDLWLLREGDPAWPGDSLAALGDEAPRWLVGWGNASLLTGEMVAVVGSREATEESLQVAEILARALVEIDRTVLSGGARGIGDRAGCRAVARRRSARSP